MLHLGILFLAVMGLYLQTLLFGFSPLDDPGLIESELIWLKNPENLSSVLFSNQIFNLQNSAFFRPVLILSFMLDAIAGQGNPAVFHLSNVLLHLFCVIMVYWLGKEVFSLKGGTALFTALVFAFHPMNVHAVAWIPGRNDLLLGMLIGGSFYFLFRYLNCLRTEYCLLHALLLYLALLTKENTIVFVPVGVLYLLLFQKMPDKNKLLLLDSAWIAVPLIWFLTRASLMEVNTPSITPGISELAESFQSLVNYGRKVILPFDPAIIPDSGARLFPLNLIITATALLLMFFPKSGSASENNKFSLFGLFWFGAFITLPILYSSSTGMGEHYNHRLYLPMMLFLPALVRRAVHLNLPFARWHKSVAAVILLVLLTAVSMNQIRFYSDKTAFTERAVAESPGLPKPYILKGRQFENAGDLDQALIQFNQLVTLFSDQEWGYINRASILAQMGEYTQARRDILRTLEISPGSSDSYNNLGNILAEQGQLDSAIVCYNTALKLEKSNLEALTNRGLTYALMGELDFALADFSDVLIQRPHQYNLYFNRGQIYQTREVYSTAARDYGSFLKYEPENADGYSNLGLCLLNIGSVEEALIALDAAIALDSTLAEPYNNRAICRYFREEYELAKIDINRFVKLGGKPNSDFMNELENKLISN